LLILLERSGKAVRSPSKSTLLAQAATSVGRGRGFGVHKALDQVGAFAGPLLAALVISLAGVIWPAMAVLAVPGAAAMVLLAVLRSRVASPAAASPTQPVQTVDSGRHGLRGWFADAVGADLPGVFFGYALAAGLTTAGLVTFGIIGYHLTVAGLVPVAVVPVVYAGAMAVEALAALGVGVVYDRRGPSVLYAVPVLVALVPPLALSGRVWVALLGVAVWGLAYGVQDSTVKALVAEVVEAPRRATAYGVFAGVQGAFAIVGGVGAGWLYERSLTTLVTVVAVTQLAALVLLARTLPAVRQR
ncbi:MAG: transporter, partial [Humibacillus sp.]|nr:transporter [Humibacillus sp.]